MTNAIFKQCPTCKLHMKESDFLIGNQECYKCVLIKKKKKNGLQGKRDRDSNEMHKCKICGKEFLCSRYFLCSKECAAISKKRWHAKSCGVSHSILSFPSYRSKFTAKSPFDTFLSTRHDPCDSDWDPNAHDPTS